MGRKSSKEKEETSAEEEAKSMKRLGVVRPPETWEMHPPRRTLYDIEEQLEYLSSELGRLRDEISKLRARPTTAYNSVGKRIATLDGIIVT